MAWHDGRSVGRRPSPGARGDRRRRQRARPRSAGVPLRRHRRTGPPGQRGRRRPPRLGRGGGRGRRALLRRGPPHRRRAAAGPGSRAARCRRAAIVLGTGRMARVRAFDPLQWRIHVEAASRPRSCAGSPAGAASGSRRIPAPPSSRRSAATWRRTPAAHTHSSTGRPGVGDRDRGRDPAGRDRDDRRPGAEERRRLRPGRPPGRFGGHARDRDGGLAPAHPRRRGGAPDRRALRRRGGRRRGDRGADGKRRRPACIEYVDEPALGATGHDFPGPPGPGFLVIAEADGSPPRRPPAARPSARRWPSGATWIDARRRRHPRPLALARLVSPRVTAVRGGKLAEDIAVPVDRLADAIRGSAAIGARHGLETMSWGHAGDGNLHTIPRGAREQGSTPAQSQPARSSSISRSGSAARSRASTASGS